MIIAQIFAFLLKIPIIQRAYISSLIDYPIDSISQQERYSFIDVDPDSVTLKFLESPPEKFNFSNEIKIIIHGWLGDGNLDWIEDMAKKYAHKNITNIISIDHGEETSSIIYPFAARVARSVGLVAADKILDFIKNDMEILDRIHIVAFSLGTHVAGYIGSAIYNKTGHRINRITSLDGAGPCFEKVDDYNRISKDDAKFVDAIHTNRRVLGLDEAYGHVDFYLNDGGPIQPECDSIAERVVGTLVGWIFGRGSFPYRFSEILDSVGICSHTKAHVVFRESILNPGKYKINKCTKRKCIDIYMGEETASHLRGEFYIND